MRRALLLLAALAIPALARAQLGTTGTVTFVPDEFIGLAACDPASTETVQVSWTVSTTSVIGGTYRIFASTEPPQDEDGDGIKLCDENDNVAESIRAGQVSDNIAATSPTQTEEIPAFRFLEETGLGEDFTCEDTQIRTIYVCVHFSPNGTPTASAVGQLTLDLRAPAKPVIRSVEPGEEALRVSWTEGTGGAVDATYYRIQARATDPALDPDTHSARIIDDSGDDESGRIGGLKNGVAYEVTVTAFSEADSASEPSDPMIGTPVPVLDFGEFYDASGGREEGGCASGPAGALAIVGAALALALHRRRK